MSADADADIVVLEVELEPAEPEETEDGSADPLELLAAPFRLAGRLARGAAHAVGELADSDQDDNAPDGAEEDDS